MLNIDVIILINNFVIVLGGYAYTFKYHSVLYVDVLYIVTAHNLCHNYNGVSVG